MNSLSLINRYIAWRVLRGILIAFMIVTGIILLIDFVEGTRNLGQDLGFNSLDVMYLTLLKIPSLIEQTIPFVVLFGVMGALYGLNRRSELIVLRATGLSAWRFLAPAVFVTFIIGVIWALCFNPIAAHTLSTYEQTVASAENTDTTQKSIWLREATDRAQTLIRANGYDPKERALTGVTVIQSDIIKDSGAEFKTRFDAERAVLSGAGYWQLYNVKENTSDVLADYIQHETISIPTNIRLEDITSQTSSDYVPPFWALPQEITRTRRSGFATTGLEMQWHKLLALPLSLVAMTFIAAGVSMHLAREGGTLKLLITGTAIGFGVYFANSIFNAFGQSSTMPVILAAWLIPIMTFFLGVSYLAKIEDG